MNPNPLHHESKPISLYFPFSWSSLFPTAAAIMGDADLRSKSLVLAKIWCMLVAFFATFIAGVSPYVLKWNDGFLVLGTQFAGGVFLGTAMMHFLCHADEMFDELTKTDYPFAFMLACVGYLITMLADCVISSSVVVKQNSASAAAGNDANHELQGSDSEKGSSHIGTSQSHCQVHFPNPAFLSASSLGDTILLVVALCFHSVFEGIAIGVAETVGDAWKTLWTVSLHKVFAAIAMGIALLKLTTNRPLLSCAAYAFALAISCPIGVAIGIIIDATAQGVVADWIYAISMSLACGVFIFVSINHLLAKGYKPENNIMVDSPFFKLLAVSLGVGVMAVVMIWDT